MTQPSDPLRQQPVVLAQFTPPDRRCEPLGELGVRYTVSGIEGLTIRAVERSVLWYTEGKGEEDIGVHFFQRVDAPGDAESPAGRFQCRLPASPLSYEGMIVKIRWCVRIRLFFAGGRDFVSEHIFDLGDVPAAAFPARS